MQVPVSNSRHSLSFPLFDWLRFVLASVVALGHEEIITWTHAGNLSVQIFFALSGWLIGGILLRTERSGLPRFFFNRGTRIWIPYFIAVAGIYLVSALRDPFVSAYFEFLFYDVTFTHNWFIAKVPEVIRAMPLEGTGGHFWSIAVEEQFYLAAPLILVLLPFGKNLVLWIGIAIVAYVTQSWYASITLGVLAAIVQTRVGDWQLQRWGVLSLLAAVAFLGIGLVIAPNAYSWLAPPTAIAVVLLTSVQGKRGRLGSFLGGMSYPLYLHHWTGMFAANFLVKRLGVPLPSIGLAAYLIAFSVAAFAYLLVDRNIQRYRDAAFTTSRGISFAVVAYLLLGIGTVGGLILSGS